MAIVELYSKRQKKLAGGMPDVFRYDVFPQPLRVQLLQIWTSTLGSEHEARSGRVPEVHNAYQTIVESLRHEYGVFELGSGHAAANNYPIELKYFMLQVQQPVEHLLDAVELACQLVDTRVRDPAYRHMAYNADAFATAALEETNVRFREHGVGYEYLAGRIIRVDAQRLHAEAVKPALSLLAEPGFEGPEEEFLSAFEHHRHGQNKEALNDALKAVESVAKAICNKRGWTYPPDATAKGLFDVLFRNGLVPAFWQAQIGALRTLLESSVPSGRNKLSGHGQGTDIKDVPDSLAAYVFHMAAATVLFLVRADKESGP